MVAAQRVVALRGAIGVFQLAEIARTLAVVQNNLLIKVCQIVKHVLKSETRNPKEAQRPKCETTTILNPPCNTSHFGLQN